MTLVEVAQVIVSLVVLCAFIGGVVLTILKNTFMTKASCTRCQAGCAATIESKFDEIKAAIDHIAEKRESMMEAQRDRDEKLYTFMGLVKGHMERAKTTEG